MAVRGLVFDVSRGCTGDGPGLRTTVFLKGCALDCPWCQNPEGKSRRPQLGWDRNRCIGCGECIVACPRKLDPADPGWRSRCRSCGRCLVACPASARRLWGRTVSPDQLVGELLEDSAFFQGSGGGVTFSGGEPLLQPQFLFACAVRLRQAGIPAAVETGGFFDPRWIGPLADGVDLILFDVKHVSTARYGPVLGKAYRRALDNLRRLLCSGANVVVRLTLVPGFNDADADIHAWGSWLAALEPAPPVEILPFHRLAAAKQALLGTEYAYAEKPPPVRAAVLRARRRLAALGLRLRD